MSESADREKDLLSPADKAKIRAEEVYRNEIRARCNSQKQGWCDWLTDKFSKPIVITAIGVFLVPLVVTTSQCCSARQSRDAERNTQRERIALEIWARCAQAEVRAVPDANKDQNPDAVRTLNGKNIAPVYAELEERTLSSLLYEEASLTPEHRETLEGLGGPALSLGTLNGKKLSDYIKSLKEAVQPLVP